jgi:hypothetical protein
MIGISNSSLGGKGTADFATAAIVGLDYTLVPHVDWRVLEFSYGRVNSVNPFNPTAFSTGIVVRLP